MSERHAERGFTLVEVLVTVLILGLLAAVVFPVVVPQINKADPTKASNDLANVRTGIELFQLDIRPREPGDLEDLVNQITTSDATVQGNTYTAGDSTNWDGPYMDRPITETDISATSTQAFTTGFDAPVLSDLYQFSSASTTVANTDSEATNGDFVTIRLINLTDDEYSLLNEQIDDDTSTGTDDAGKLRRDDSQDSDVDNNANTGDSSGFDTVTYFLAVPLK